MKRQRAGSSPRRPIRSPVKNGEATSSQQIAGDTIADKVEAPTFPDHQGDPRIVSHVRHTLARPLPRSGYLLDRRNRNGRESMIGFERLAAEDGCGKPYHSDEHASIGKPVQQHDFTGSS
jgi:hypothetical protein